MLNTSVSQFRMLTHTKHVCKCRGQASTVHRRKMGKRQLALTVVSLRNIANNIHNHQKAVTGGRAESCYKKLQTSVTTSDKAATSVSSFVLAQTFEHQEKTGQNHITRTIIYSVYLKLLTSCNAPRAYENVSREHCHLFYIN